MRRFYLTYTEDIKNLAQAAREFGDRNLAQVVRELQEGGARNSGFYSMGT